MATDGDTCSAVARSRKVEWGADFFATREFPWRLSSKISSNAPKRRTSGFGSTSYVRSMPLSPRLRRFGQEA